MVSLDAFIIAPDALSPTSPPAVVLWNVTCLWRWRCRCRFCWWWRRWRWRRRRRRRNNCARRTGARSGCCPTFWMRIYWVRGHLLKFLRKKLWHSKCECLAKLPGQSLLQERSSNSQEAPYTISKAACRISLFQTSNPARPLAAQHLETSWVGLPSVVARLYN